MSVSWTLWEFAVCAPRFLPCPISCQYKEIEEATGAQGTIVSLGFYSTDWYLSWNLTLWRKEDPDVLNNKVPQTDNERQLWKRQRQPLDVLITVLQAETGKYRCSCVKYFCCLLWGNASHFNHSHLRHKLKNGQDDPELGDPITYEWLDLFNPSKQNREFYMISDYKYIIALLWKENSAKVREPFVTTNYRLIINNFRVET